MHVSFNEWEATLRGLRPSSPAWRAIIGAINGDPLSDESTEIFHKLARRSPPPNGASEAIVIGGRRGGKSETTARWLVHQALFGGHGAALAPGQRGVLAVISAERAMSKEIIAYVRGLAAHPAIKRHVLDVKEESVDFKTGVSVRILTADSTSVRSGTIVGAVLDEACFLEHEPCADPDTAIIEALRPGLAPVVGAPPRRMIVISSAGTRSGWVYDRVQESHGVNDAEILTVVATTRDLNPNIDPAYLRKRELANPRTFEREHLSVFSDVITDSWFGHETLQRAVDRNRNETPYEDGLRYVVSVDPATQRDQWAVVVSTHRYFYDEQGIRRRRVDVVFSRAWLPKPGQELDVRTMIGHTRQICEAYGTSRVIVDQFGGQMLRSMFRDVGIRAEQVAWTGQGDDSKYQRYLRVKDGLRDGSIRLTDDPALISELQNIRGTALPAGGERLEASIGHDDLASACVLGCSVAMTLTPTFASTGPYAEHRHERQAREQAMRRVGLAIHGCG